MGYSCYPKESGFGNHIGKPEIAPPETQKAKQSHRQICTCNLLLKRTTRGHPIELASMSEKKKCKINKVMLAKPPIPKVTMLRTSKISPRDRSSIREMITQEEIMMPSKIEPKRNASEIKNESLIFSSNGKKINNRANGIPMHQ